MTKPASKRSNNAPWADQLALLRTELDKRAPVLDVNGERVSRTIRDHLLMQLLKKAAEGSAPAYKFISGYQVEFNNAYEAWSRAKRKADEADHWAGVGMGGILIIPFGWDIDKVLAHSRTLEDKEQAAFFADLSRGVNTGVNRGPCVPPPEQFAP